MGALPALAPCNSGTGSALGRHPINEYLGLTDWTSRLSLQPGVPCRWMINNEMLACPTLHIHQWAVRNTTIEGGYEKELKLLLISAAWLPCLGGSPPSFLSCFLFFLFFF